MLALGGLVSRDGRGDGALLHNEERVEDDEKEGCCSALLSSADGGMPSGVGLRGASSRLCSFSVWLAPLGRDNLSESKLPAALAVDR